MRAAGANSSTTPTFSPNGLTAYTIVKNGGNALNQGDIAGAGHELLLRYDLGNTRWELLNPSEAASALDLDAASADFPWQFFTVKDASPVYVGDGSGDKLRVNFDGGTAAINSGDTVVAASGGTGVADIDAVVTSGSYGTSDAAGYVVLRGATGTFSNNDNLQVSSVTKAVQNGATSAVYNIDYMNGVWMAVNLYWDEANGCISRFEDTKNKVAVGFQIASTRFPDSAIADYSAMTVWRVKPASAATATQSPDRLVSPTAGQNGGPQFVITMTSEGQIAKGGSTDEMDGDGSTIGYARRVFQLISQTWYHGLIQNSYAARNAVDSATHPSAYAGTRQTLDTTGATTGFDYVIQHAGTTSGTPSFDDVLAFDLTDGPYNVEREGTALVQNPLAQAVVTQAHGQPGRPSRFLMELECLTADGSYGAGDVIFTNEHAQVAGGGAVWTVQADATNVYFRNTGGQPNAASKAGTPANFNLTLNNWKMTIRNFFGVGP